MRSVRALALLLAAAIHPVFAAGAESAPARHAVIVSIDGLMPSVYTRPDELGLAVPNLRALAAEGAFARGVVGVLPSVTYPSHTTLITGVAPREHGILYNTYFDPLGKSNDAWLWYAREVRVPTLVSAARARGRTVGAVSWPVSVGLEADFLIAEHWRSGSEHESDLELIRALSTPGVIESAAAARGRPFGWPSSDVDRTDLALSILRDHRPGLLLLHLFELDKNEHTYGPLSPEARASIEASDRELGRLLAAIRELGLGGKTLVAVVSDHGFVTVTKVVRPNWLLAQNGLLELDDKGKVKSWKAYVHSHGGTGSLRLADPSDAATRTKVRELFAAKLAEPGSGLGAIVERKRLDELGADPHAELVLEAADGYSISRTPTGGWEGPSTDRGYHGYSPDRPEMHASLILAGPGLAKRGDLGLVPMTAIAPMVAAWLDLQLAPSSAPPLPLFAPGPPKR